MDYSLLLILVLAAGAMFLLTSRSRKQQREAQNMLASLTPGQEVMTRSGMFGTVVEVDDEKNTVTLESESGARTVWLRGAIGRVIPPEVPDEETDEDSDATITSGPDDENDDAVVDFAVPDDLSGLSDQGVDLDKDSRRRREDGDEDIK